MTEHSKVMTANYWSLSYSKQFLVVERENLRKRKKMSLNRREHDHIISWCRRVKMRRWKVVNNASSKYSVYNIDVSLKNRHPSCWTCCDIFCMTFR